jgi:hypothetical protein
VLPGLRTDVLNIEELEDEIIKQTAPVATLPDSEIEI